MWKLCLTPNYFLWDNSYHELGNSCLITSAPWAGYHCDIPALQIRKYPWPHVLEIGLKSSQSGPSSPKLHDFLPGLRRDSGVMPASGWPGVWYPSSSGWEDKLWGVCVWLWGPHGNCHWLAIEARGGQDNSCCSGSSSSPQSSGSSLPLCL